MSILVKEVYANPTTPLWGAAGSGGGAADPVLIYSTTTSIGTPIPNADPYVLDTFTQTTAPSVNGTYVVKANINVYGQNGNNLFNIIYGCLVGDTLGNKSLFSVETFNDGANAPLTWVSGSTTLVVPWVVADGPLSWNVAITPDQPSDSSAYLTWSVIFYPN